MNMEQQFACDFPGCFFTSPSKQGVAAHKATHLSQEEKDRRSAKRMTTLQNKKVNKAKSNDDLLDRIDKATRVLFPDVKEIVDKFDDVADLRMAMLQVLKK